MKYKVEGNIYNASNDYKTNESDPELSECQKHDYPEKWCGACIEEMKSMQKKHNLCKSSLM